MFTFLQNIIKAKPQIKLIDFLVLITWHPLCVLWNIEILPGENVYVCMFSVNSKESRLILMICQVGPGPDIVCLISVTSY